MIKNLLRPILTSIFFLACSTNPFTGKKTFNMVSNDQLFPMSFQQYSEFLEENEVVKGTDEAAAIEKVGQNISAAARRWFDKNGPKDYLDGYAWEYHLVKGDRVNAWCMPGGKIVFYTGILPVAKNESGIAAIMGHEVAHALADHGAQRMSQAQLQALGAVGVGVATSGQDPETQAAIMAAYGVGSSVGVMLPFSRKHESEADKIGLTLMAIAGYDPDEAANLWRRMKESKNGEGPSEFFSTHPSADTRIADIERLAPQAKAEAKTFGITSFKEEN